MSISLYNKMLEARVRHLENLILEQTAEGDEPITRPRTRQVKQNLFSRKLEEVKAAVEAGQDPTAPNEKGKTPLMYACSDPKGQSGAIIEYLLEHGANANDVDGKRPVLFACCKFGDSRGVKALVAHGANVHAMWKDTYPIRIAMREGKIYDDALLSLVDRNLRFHMDICNIIVNQYFTGHLSAEVYHAIIEKFVSVHNGDVEECVWPAHIMDELRNGERYLLDLYIKHGIMPQIHSISDYTNTELSRAVGKFGLDALNDLITAAAEGRIKVKDAAAFISFVKTVFSALHKDISTITPLVITVDYIRGIEADDVVTLIHCAVLNKIPDVLDTIIKAKRKDLDYSTIIEIVTGNFGYDRYSVPDSMVKQICRILSKCLPAPHNGVLSSMSIAYIRCSDSKRFIEFMVDCGFGKILVNGISHRDIDSLSKEFIKVMKENDISIRPLEDSSDEERSEIMRNRFINKIIDAIIHDAWTRDLEKYVTEHPDILSEEAVIDEIENHPDSVIARQLKRRIDRTPKEADTYDM